jgi:hypothetical protein
MEAIALGGTPDTTVDHADAAPDAPPGGAAHDGHPSVTPFEPGKP